MIKPNFHCPTRPLLITYSPKQTAYIEINKVVIEICIFIQFRTELLHFFFCVSPKTAFNSFVTFSSFQEKKRKKKKKKKSEESSGPVQLSKVCESLMFIVDWAFMP